MLKLRFCNRREDSRIIIALSTALYAMLKASVVFPARRWSDYSKSFGRRHQLLDYFNHCWYLLHDASAVVWSLLNPPPAHSPFSPLGKATVDRVTSGVLLPHQREQVAHALKFFANLSILISPLLLTLFYDYIIANPVRQNWYIKNAFDIISPPPRSPYTAPSPWCTAARWTWSANPS